MKLGHWWHKNSEDLIVFYKLVELRVFKVDLTLLIQRKGTNRAGVSEK